MITKWNFEVDSNLKNKGIYNLGSVFHGALMEKLSDEMQELLHNDSRYSPLKQRLYRLDDKTIWEVVSLDDKLENQLIQIFQNEIVLYLKSHQEYVKLNLIDKLSISQDQIIKNVYSQDNIKKYFDLKILTPMSFKSNGKNDIFPDLRKIFRSAMLQFDSFSSDRKLYDAETLDYLTEYSQIVDYRLRSTKFYLEGTKIPAFMGELTIRVNAPLPILQLVEVLLRSAVYTGVGVKTSLGMGKIQIKKNKMW